MALFLQIVDDFGNPDAVSNLADTIIDEAKTHGIGLFKTEAKVEAILRQVINSLVRDGLVSIQNPVLKACDGCENAVSIWHTYPDGTSLCTACRPKVE
jgi:hypothetical protein